MFTGSKEKTYCISGCFQARIEELLASLSCSEYHRYKIPRLAQKDFFHVLERVFSSDVVGGVCFCLCIVALSQFCALKQFFIQTNIPSNDLQDADHGSVISIPFSATQHQKISKQGELLFISHHMTNQTLITISANIRSTNHLFCSYCIFCMPPQIFPLVLQRNSSSYMKVLESKYMDINSVGSVPSCLPGG